MKKITLVLLAFLLCSVTINAIKFKTLLKTRNSMNPSSSSSSMSSSSAPIVIGFASSTVLSDDETKQEDPVGDFQVPTTDAAGADFPDLSMKNTADESIIPGMTANINGEVVTNIIKNALMGEHHPVIWSPTHCIQVPAIVRPNGSASAPPNCATESGWYLDVAAQSCQPTSVTCSQIATLNFFYNVSECEEMCIQDGKPIEWIKTNVNLNPEEVCIQQPVLTWGTSSTLEIVYSYDAVTMTCWKYKIPHDSVVSLNVYTGTTAGAVCEHMCHDIGPAGSGVGHSLATPIPGLPSTANPVQTMDNMT